MKKNCKNQWVKFNNQSNNQLNKCKKFLKKLSKIYKKLKMTTNNKNK